MGRPSAARRSFSLITPCRAAMAAARAASQARPIVGRKNSQRAVAHELENVATLLLKCRDNDIGIVVEQGDDMLRRGIGYARKAAQIAEPKHGIDAVGHAAHDSTAQHAAPGIAPEV